MPQMVDTKMFLAVATLHYQQDENALIEKWLEGCVPYNALYHPKEKERTSNTHTHTTIKNMLKIRPSA